MFMEALDYIFDSVGELDVLFNPDKVCLNSLINNSNEKYLGKYAFR